MTTHYYHRAKQLFSYLSLRSFDVSTQQGRAKERQRRIVMTAVAAAGTKIVTIGTTFITVPLTVNYLGTERFGMWATISSFVGLLSFADLGIGNGLLNAISEANGKDDKQLAKEYVSSAFFLMIGLAVILAAGFSLVNKLVSWPSIFNVNSQTAIVEAGPAIIIFMVCFLVNLPLGIVQRIQMGYQEGFVNSIWLTVGHLFSLAGLLVVIYARAGLPWLVLAMVGGPVLSSFMNGVALFRSRRSYLLPRPSYVSWDAMYKILKLGILFFFLQLATSLAYTSDNIVIAQVLGPDKVTQYAVPYKLFAFLPMFASFALNPLWPAYGEAITRKDLAWVKRILQRSIVGTLILVGSLSIILVLIGKPIIDIWVGSSISPSFALLLGFGVWALLRSLGNTLAMFLNGANIIRFQVITALSMASVSVVAKIYLAQSFGVAGIVWAMVGAYTILSFIPQILYMPRIWSRLVKTQITP